MKTKLYYFASIAIYFLMFFCLMVNTSYGQDTQESTISIDSTLVNVPVIVSDKQGRYVSGLKLEDFVLYDDKVKQSIAFFDAAEEPLNVALLLDTSKSASDVLEDIKSAAFTFLSQLRSQDKVMIVSFDNRVRFLTSLTNDRYKLERAIEGAEIGFQVGTKLNDAVDKATTELKFVTGRKAIVLLTDGKDHGSYLSADELIDSIIESNTLIYTIFYATKQPIFVDQIPPQSRPFPRRKNPLGFPRFPQRDGNREERRQERRNEKIMAKNEQAMDFLTELAEVTAGRMYKSEITDLRKTFGLIADELRHQYILGFYPDNTDFADIPHSIKVQVTRKEVVVRARHSYKLLTNN